MQITQADQVTPAMPVTPAMQVIIIAMRAIMCTRELEHIIQMVLEQSQNPDLPDFIRNF